MTDNQRNKLNMYVMVRDLLLASVTITNKLVVFAALIATFTDYVTEIFAVSEQQERDNTGVTKTKQAIRAELIKMMELISKKCVGYASGVEDYTFMQMIKVTKSQLKNLADADLVKKAEDMITNVTPKLPELAGYSITQDVLDALRGLTSDFVSIYTTPTGNKESKAQLTAKLNLLFRNTDAVLKKMDAQSGALFDTDPDFCDEFTRKRAIVKLARRLRAFQMWITDEETGLPIGKANVKIMKKDGSNLMTAVASSGTDLQKIVKRAGTQGGVFMNNLTAGEYSYEVSLGGYVMVTDSFFINDGLMTEVKVGMKKVA